MSKNLATTTVAVAPSPATSGTTLTVATGTGSRLYDGMAVLHPTGVAPTAANAEVVSITVSGDVVTLTRARESSTARTVVVGDVLTQGITAAMWDGLVSSNAGKADAGATTAALAGKAEAAHAHAQSDVTGLAAALAAKLDVTTATGTYAPLAPDWITARAYVVGELVVSSGTLYRCTTAHVSGASINLANFAAIGGGALADGSVTTSKLADGSVTAVKLAGSVTSLVKPLPGVPVATNCWYNGFTGAGLGNLPGAAVAGTTRSRHRAAVDCGDIVLAYGNIRTPGTTVEVAGANTYTIKASVEWNGAVIPVTFNGGLTGTCSPGGLLLSDPVGVEYTKGADFWVRTFATADGTNIVNPNTILYQAQQNGFVATTDLTPTGSANVTDAASDQYGYAPAAILGTPYPATATSVSIIGDSISVGTGDGGSGGLLSEFGRNGAAPLFTGGFIVRALGRNFGYVNTGQGSETAFRFVAAHRRAAIIGTSRHVICQYGINDVSANRTLAQIQADYLTIWRLARLRGASGVWQCTIAPSTGSTDNWTTTGNQTPFAADPVRQSVNAWLRDGAPLNASTLAPVATGTGGAVRCATYGTTGALVQGPTGGAGHPLLGGVFDTGGAVEQTVGASIWKVDGVTARFTSQDGTHPSTNGHTLMAAAINTALLV